jgi:crossover junction endodeoxyribonuclease RusA
MTKTIEIRLPLPPPCLSPNARAHYRPKAAATRSMRGLACRATRAAMEAGEVRGGWTGATVRIVYRLPTRRRRDRDNLLCSLKAAFDGVADAGLVVDDSAMTYLPVGVEVCRRGEEGVSIEIEEGDSR